MDIDQTLGTRQLGNTVAFKFTSTMNGAPVSLAGSPAVGVYKAGTTSPITAGVTLTQDYNSTTGLNDVSIVASVGNGYATGTDYVAAMNSGTIGGVSQVGVVLAKFTLG